MKQLFTYITLTCAIASGLSTYAVAYDDADNYTTITPKASVQLGTDADYNLDYVKNDSADCEINKKIGLTPEQKSKLRGSRLSLEKFLKDANMTPEEDAKLQARKVHAVMPILTGYQFQQYVAMRERCE